MKIREVQPEVNRDGVLAGAQFADAFRVTIPDVGLDARGAAERIFSRSPRWVEALLKLRNMIVAPLGLKASGSGEPNTGGMIGIFPVLDETPQRLIAGFDDHHLDFRVVVDIAPADAGQDVTTTTLVRTHNRLGRAYLAVIAPFHRMVTKAMLAQVCRGPAR